MKINLLTSLCLIFLFCGCASFDAQLNEYEKKIENEIDDKHWFAAKNIADNSEFIDGKRYSSIIEGWRKYQSAKIKSGFAKSLVPWVDKVKEFYYKGDFEKGDDERLRLRNYYFGGVVPSNQAIMPELEECVHLALLQMQSDRSLALMSQRFSKLNEEIQKLDIKNEGAAYNKLRDYEDQIVKILHYKNKIDEFMLAIDPEDVRRWAQMNRTSYARDIKKMEKLQGDCKRNIALKKWNILVDKRKSEYKKIYKLIEQSKCEEASALINSLTKLYPPSQLGSTYYDDEGERKKVEKACALKQWNILVERRKSEYAKIYKLIEQSKFEAASAMLSSLQTLYPPIEIQNVDFNDSEEKNKVSAFYSLRLWEAEVKKRKEEYVRIEILLKKGEISKASEELKTLRPLVAPNVSGILFYDDNREKLKYQNRILKIQWDNDIKKRKEQYKIIKQLIQDEKFDAAKQMLVETSEELVKPNIYGLEDFDDSQHRANLLSGELGMEMVYHIFLSGMTGVQHYRLTKDGDLSSVVVVGRASINYHDKTVGKNAARREAKKRAELNARNELAKFLNSRISSMESSEVKLSGDNVNESYSSALVLKTSTFLSGMVQLAEGVDGEEVVLIMGWHSPHKKISSILPSKSFKSKDFFVSPSIGFFL